MPDLQLVLLHILGIKIEVGNWALWAKPGTSVGRSRRIVNSQPQPGTHSETVSQIVTTIILMIWPVFLWRLGI